MITPRFIDNFNGIDGDGLNSNLPDLGEGWDQIIAGVYSSNDGWVFQPPDTQLFSATRIVSYVKRVTIENVLARIDVRCYTTGVYGWGFFLRANSTTDSGYFIYRDSATANLYVQRYDAGVATTLVGPIADSLPVVGAVQRIEAQVITNGSQNDIQVSIDGVILTALTCSDSSGSRIVGVGRCGVDMRTVTGSFLNSAAFLRVAFSETDGSVFPPPVATVATIPITDPNIVVTGSFYDDGTGTAQASGVRANATKIVSADVGTHIRIRARTTQFTPVFVVSQLVGMVTADFPIIRWRIDRGEWRLTRLNSGAQRPLSVEALSDEYHTLQIYFEANAFTINRYNPAATPFASIQITGVEVDTGRSSSPVIGAFAPLADNAVFYGDSITAGHAVDRDTTLGASNYATWCRQVAARLKCNAILVGKGNQGWQTADVQPGGVPKFSDLATGAASSWKFFALGVSRLSGGLATPQAKHVFINHGTCDQIVTNGDPTASVTAELPRVRAAYPTAIIWLVIPFAGFKRTQITAGFAAYQLATPDARCVLLDIGTTIAGGGLTSSSGGDRTNFGYHPNARSHVNIANCVVAGVLTKSPDAAIYVQSLNNDDVVHIGQVVTIAWGATALVGATVNVLLSLDGGATYPITLASGIEVHKRYTWTVAAEHVSGLAKLKVVDAGASGVFGETLGFNVATTEPATGGIPRSRLINVGSL